MKYSGTACFELTHLFTGCYRSVWSSFSTIRVALSMAESGFKEFDLGRKGQFIKYLVMANDPNFQRKTSVGL